MIDGVKLECNYLVNEWLNNNKLDFPLLVSEKTGEIIESNRVSKYKGLSFNITPSKVNKSLTYHSINGSLHKFHNDGKTNADNFTYKELLNTVKTLVNDFSIVPHLTTLRNIEFGVNLELPITADKFLKMLVSMPNKRFTELSVNRVKIGKVCKIGDREIKIYNKGKQEKRNTKNLVRIEIKYKRMRELNKKYNIKTLDDLRNPNTFTVFFDMLKELINDLIIYENNIDLNKLSTEQKLELKDYINPLFWENLNFRSRYKLKLKYENLTNKTSPQKMKMEILNLIGEKQPCLMNRKQIKKGCLPQGKNNNEADKKGMFATLEYRRQISPLTKKNTEPKTEPKKRYCKTCGRDISHQRKDSIYCSEKHFGKAAKKCRNKASNKTRQAKRNKARNKELKQLNELFKILPESNLYLRVIIRTPKGKYKEQRQRQQNIKHFQYNEFIKIAEIKVKYKNEKYHLTKTRAKELIKKIISINLNT